jgi:alpha-tubulin suppressor-like RCC1 family protein
VGQLGIGSTTNKYTAQTVLNIEGVTQLTTAGYRNCVLFGTGEVKCWGYNYYGQLGIGSTANQGDGAGEMEDIVVQ